MSRVFFPTTSLNRWGVRVTGEGRTLGGVNPKFYQEPTPRSASNPTGPMLGAFGAVVRNIEGEGAVMQTASGPVALQNAASQIIRVPVPIIYLGPMPVANPPAPVSSSGGGGAIQAPAPIPDVAAPVSTQTTPTPVAVTPAPPAAIPVMISSGGGTVTQNIPASAVVTTPTVTVPIVYSTDAYGNVINAATGAVVLTAAQAASMGTSAAALNAGANPAPSTAVTVASSPDITSQIATWLGGSTTLAGYAVPNALLAGAVVLGFAFLSNHGKKR